jgi:branched-chain amino acid transport system ATP-binding protein
MGTLRCQGIFKSFDGVRALAGAGLEFPSSGIVAVIGPNGAGKTTLLNILTGFLRPDAGRCFLGDGETTHLALRNSASPVRSKTSD